MSTVTLEPALYDRIARVAQAHQRSIPDTLTEALQKYLWDLDRQKISAESATYRRRYPELRERYLGRYIAMHDGEVVDDAADFDTLYRRVTARYPDTPVMLTQVESEPDAPLVRRGFRWEHEGK